MIQQLPLVMITMESPINKTLPKEKLGQYKWLVVFMGGVFFLLILSAIFRALTVPPPPALTVIRSEQLPATVSFANLTVDIPNKVTVYRTETEKLNVRDFASTLAEKLKLQLHSTINYTWVNQATDESLYLEDRGLFIGYSAVYVDENFRSLPQISVEEVKSKSLQFISEKQLLSDVQVSENYPINISTEGFERTDHQEDINGYELVIVKRIDNLPFYQDTISDNLATIWTDLSGRIIKMRFFPISIKLQPINTYTSLPLSVIEKNMQEGLITYIRTQPLKARRDDSQNLTSVQFDKAVVEYRQNTLNGYILPYLRFSGLGKDSDDQEYYVEAISPAVKIE